MKCLRTGFCLCLFAHPLQASDLWEFEEKIAITEKPATGVFHHLQGAGRKHLAVSADSIAVVWEDDHSGDPQIYLGTKKTGDKSFTNAAQVSTGLEAYEPAVTFLTGSHFVIGWEQDGSVFVRLTKNQQLSAPLKLSKNIASQVSLATMDDKVFAVWRESWGRNWSLRVAVLGVDAAGELILFSTNRIETQALETPVLFPTLAANKSGLMVAWEDRQAGHTRLKYSFSEDKGQSFSTPLYLNEFFSNRNKYDKGSGVTRVSMTSYAEDEFLAAWMDKRRGGVGYGIYSAFGSENSFGPNEKVHSLTGDKLPHYNPAVAGNQEGNFVVAWDDYRQGDSDIWISSYTDEDEWSTDFAPAPASGDGEQSHVSITLDEQGSLHMVWIERENIDAPTRLWYSYGKR